MYEFSEYAQNDGLMSYGVDSPVMFRRAASYVDRGAKTLGLAIPPSVLLRADQVIE